MESILAHHFGQVGVSFPGASHKGIHAGAIPALATGDVNEHS